MTNAYDHWVNTPGHSPNHGLGEGDWVPRPGSAGIQDWVGEKEPPPNVCATCPATVSSRATYCPTCKRVRELALLKSKRSAA